MSGSGQENSERRMTRSAAFQRIHTRKRMFRFFAMFSTRCGEQQMGLVTILANSIPIKIHFGQRDLGMGVTRPNSSPELIRSFRRGRYNLASGGLN